MSEQSDRPVRSISVRGPGTVTVEATFTTDADGRARVIDADVYGRVKATPRKVRGGRVVR